MDIRLATLKQSFSICCTMFQHWINAERFPVSHLCVNTLPASWQSVYTRMWHREPLCVDSVLKHCAVNRKRLFQRCQTYVHIYTTLAFLALLGAPYIYEISSLRVKLTYSILQSICSSVHLFYLRKYLTNFDNFVWDVQKKGDGRIIFGYQYDTTSSWPES